MKPTSRLAFAAAGLATLGLLAPPTFAQQPAASAPNRPAAASPAPVAAATSRPSRPITDVKLTTDGGVSGRVIDTQGEPIDGAKVTVSQGDRRVAEVTTNRQGQFRVPGLKTGVYQVATPVRSATVRAWSPRVAPPSAKETLVLVSGDSAVRAQFGFVEPDDCAMLLLGVTGVTLSAIALAEIMSVKSDVDQIEKDVVSP